MQQHLEFGTDQALRPARRRMPTYVASVAATELESILPALIELLVDNVNAGASLGFHAPLARDEARAYWLSLGPELRAGSRLLLVAHAEGRIVGTGQLALASAPSSRHRAELQKLFITPALQGAGIGRTLVDALHDAARRDGRTLLILCTRSGEPPVSFYKRLGYREIGVIPGFTRGPTGRRHDSVTLWHELAP